MTKDRDVSSQIYACHVLISDLPKKKKKKPYEAQKGTSVDQT